MRKVPPPLLLKQNHNHYKFYQIITPDKDLERGSSKNSDHHAWLRSLVRLSFVEQPRSLSSSQKYIQRATLIWQKPLSLAPTHPPTYPSTYPQEVPQSWLLEQDSRNQGERVTEATHRMQQSIQRAAVPCVELLHQIRGTHVAKAIHTHLPSLPPFQDCKQQASYKLTAYLFPCTFQSNLCSDLLFSLSLFNTWQFPIAII